ncbi:hypothetical protein TanjilG_25566 [Lupinus angustifolius]|uniref:Uncharacterized protein n=1 Tax=Lupinus angustifolius TaxID=3871 RepID=A0A4P1QTA1_LUPAN|nr:hypothetical protein TanjilG_25566 [Lupinus angustifolius]
MARRGDDKGGASVGHVQIVVPDSGSYSRRWFPPIIAVALQKEVTMAFVLVSIIFLPYLLSSSFTDGCRFRRARGNSFLALTAPKVVRELAPFTALGPFDPGFH